MLPYYKRFLIQIFTDVQELQLSPWEDSSKCLLVQEKLIKKIVYVENRVRELKRKIKTSKKRLGTRTKNRLMREEATSIKVDIKSKQATIQEYKHLLHIFRSVGDALAFIYISKWDIKPMTFKEDAGFISGKIGLRSELKALRLAFQVGGIAILNDITTCLRYADITLLRQDAPPMFIEIKSSKNLNQRAKRQYDESAKLTEYLQNDQIEKDGYLVRRVASNSAENNYILEMNILLAEARNDGFGFMQVEEGLFYYVETDYAEDRLKTIVQGLRNPPIVFFLNALKYTALGYYPFTLSICNPETLYGFYQGELLIFVFVDPQTISSKFLNNNLVVSFIQDEDWAFSVQHNNSDNTNVIGPLNVGQHLWGRIGYEFLSLDWFVEEIIHKFNLPIVEEWSTSLDENES